MGRVHNQGVRWLCGHTWNKEDFDSKLRVLRTAMRRPPAGVSDFEGRSAFRSEIAATPLHAALGIPPSRYFIGALF